MARGSKHPRYGSKLREQSVLTLGKSCRPRAFLVIVNDTIDTTVHGITPHEPSIAGAQQFGHCGNVLHARIEIVAVLIKDDWRSVMNRRCDGICSRRQDRAGLQRFGGVGSQWPRDCRYLNAANEIGRV